VKPLRVQTGRYQRFKTRSRRTRDLRILRDESGSCSSNYRSLLLRSTPSAGARCRFGPRCSYIVVRREAGSVVPIFQPRSIRSRICIFGADAVRADEQEERHASGARTSPFRNSFLPRHLLLRRRNRSHLRECVARGARGGPGTKRPSQMVFASAQLARGGLQWLIGGVTPLLEPSRW